MRRSGSNLARRESETEALIAFDDCIASGMTQRAALSQAISLYPDHSDTLTDYVLQIMSISSEGIVDNSQNSLESLASFDQIAIKTAEKQRQKSSTFIGIFAHADGIKITPASIASKLRLGLSVLRKLDQRLIIASTIPQMLIETLADEINVHVEVLRQYFSGEPKLAAGAEYKSNKAPKPGTRQQTFVAAVAISVRSGEMDNADAASWEKSPDELE